MKVYISGKIGDLPEEIYLQKFKDAEKMLISLGHETVNPCEIEHNHGKTWEEYMVCDIKALFPCDAIFMLDNWKDSRGARIERVIAKEMGKIQIFQSRDHQLNYGPILGFNDIIDEYHAGIK